MSALRGLAANALGKKPEDVYLAVTMLPPSVGSAISKVIIARTTESERGVAEPSRITLEADVLREELTGLWRVTSPLQGGGAVSEQYDIQFGSPAIFVMGPDVQGLREHTDNKEEAPRTAINQLLKTSECGGSVNLFFRDGQEEIFRLFVFEGGCVISVDQDVLHCLPHGVRDGAQTSCTIMTRSMIVHHKKMRAHNLVLEATKVDGLLLSGSTIFRNLGAATSAPGGPDALRSGRSSNSRKLGRKGDGGWSRTNQLMGARAKRC